MTKLHLGAGRIILPVTAETQPYHLAPMPPSAFEPGWVNIDKFKMSGIDEAIDLFQFPWIRSSNGMPFLDNSVDAIYASHFVEHIPHKVEMSNRIPLNWRKDYEEAVANLDGWFVFFRECWRVLKPGGLVHIICPFGLSFAGMNDPSHTRYVLPDAFNYLIPNPEAPFDYHMGCHFVPDGNLAIRYTMDWHKKRMDEGVSDTEMNIMAATYFNVADEIRVNLRAVKDASPS